MTSAVYDFKAIKSQVKDGDWWKPAKDEVPDVEVVSACGVVIERLTPEKAVALGFADGGYLFTCPTTSFDGPDEGVTTEFHLSELAPDFAYSLIISWDEDANKVVVEQRA